MYGGHPTLFVWETTWTEPLDSGPTTVAEQIRAEIEQLAASGSDVLIDFEGVRSVSYSFADELIGVFASRYEADHDSLRPVVIGLTQAQRVLLGSLEQRGLSDEVSRQLVPH
jgi:hypothetical protein